jgi:hypothetical protein
MADKQKAEALFEPRALIQSHTPAQGCRKPENCSVDDKIGFDPVGTPL